MQDPSTPCAGPAKVSVEIVPRLADIPAAEWDACANPDPATYNPFVGHGFLSALEAAGAVGGRTGWTPRHLVMRDAEGAVAACAPAYLKSHSQGEYVFDQGWAEAYMRADGDYYPKLQLAVPFTPVPGPRLLVRPGADAAAREELLARAVVEVAGKGGLSGAHVTFLTEAQWQRLGQLGFLQRTDQQFHWSNDGYASFEDFLASLASRKRKAVRKERETALSAGLEVVWLRGREITQAHWDTFFDFYMDTGSRKWGRPYLNRSAFSLVAAATGEAPLLMLAMREGRAVAGSFHMIGGDCLFGRYWGATEHHPCLHFELCYSPAIAFASAHGLKRVEAGAQGEHKLARGYLPTKTYSAHYICDPALRRAVADYLSRERLYVERAGEELAAYAPYRRGEKQED
ncbi:MAG: GNAT family N-acetyltransferase [Hyphomicrobiaceae bacterium]|nr:GNAT family N-acetyltransferase [Hyphomicrobiaceae bacterium]